MADSNLDRRAGSGKIAYMDTKYFIRALEAWQRSGVQYTNMKVGDLSIAELSTILRAAQKLKDDDQNEHEERKVLLEEQRQNDARNYLDRKAGR